MSPKKTSFRLLATTFAAVISSVVVTATASAAELRVFAAASLSDALTEIAPFYTKSTGDKLTFNFSASGTLARQIQEGAPADVVISADELRLDQLTKAGLLANETRRTLLANTLVVVTAPNSAKLNSLADLKSPSTRRIALGLPASVPAGTYTKAYLEKLQLWSALETKVVFVDNVRAVLSTVEAGNADAGFVYKTDALSSKKVTIAYEISRAEGPSITYPAAAVKASRSPEAAAHLITWLAGDEAQAIFAKHGFLAVETPSVTLAPAASTAPHVAAPSAVAP